VSYRLELLPVGRGEVPGPELYWMREWDRWFELCFQVALIRGRGRTVLVNTGPARDLGPMNAQWARFLGERAAMRRGDGEFIVAALAARGVHPEDITDVVLTPFQLYTVSNVPLFRRPRFHLSRRGWVHFHTTHAHPHDDRDSSLPRTYSATSSARHGTVSTCSRTRTRSHPASAPGGRVRTTAPRSWVEVDTPEGVAALSDAYFYVENVERRHPIGISENIYEALACYDRVTRGERIVVPLYDPKNLDRFPDGIG
jgi:hypothetical protein